MNQNIWRYLEKAFTRLTIKLYGSLVLAAPVPFSILLGIPDSAEAGKAPQFWVKEFLKSNHRLKTLKDHAVLH